MFVYLLIASELAILYTVFWYLYVREPKVNRRISANLWGTYEESMMQADPMLPFLRSDDYNRIYDEAYASTAREYVLDQVTNHYVPVGDNATVVQRVAVSLDRTFSRLNVKP